MAGWLAGWRRGCRFVCHRWKGTKRESQTGRREIEILGDWMRIGTGWDKLRPCARVCSFACPIQRCHPMAGKPHVSVGGFGVGPLVHYVPPALHTYAVNLLRYVFCTKSLCIHIYWNICTNVLMYYRMYVVAHVCTLCKKWPRGACWPYEPQLSQPSSSSFCQNFLDALTDLRDPLAWIRAIDPTRLIPLASLQPG